MRYPSVDDTVRNVISMGKGYMLAKFDIESHIGSYQYTKYVDMALLFGIRSVPKVFTALADGLEWILMKDKADLLHYLDDFLLFGEGQEQCAGALTRTDLPTWVYAYAGK